MTQSRNNLSLIQYLRAFYANFMWLWHRNCIKLALKLPSINLREKLSLIIFLFFHFCVRGSRTSKALVSLTRRKTMFDWKAHRKFSSLSENSLGRRLPASVCVCVRWESGWMANSREYARSQDYEWGNIIFYGSCVKSHARTRQGYLSASWVLVSRVDIQDAGGKTGTVRVLSLSFYSRKNHQWLNRWRWCCEMYLDCFNNACCEFFRGEEFLKKFY